MLQRLNVGRLDRSVRAIAGLGVVVHYAVGYGVFGWLLPLAAFCLASAAMGSCPLYRLMRISTRKRRYSAWRKAHGMSSLTPRI